MSYTYGSNGTCKLAGGASSSYYQCRLGYQVNSQNSISNSSNITLRFEVRSTSSSYATRGYTQTTTIDGEKLSGKTFDMSDTNTWQVFGEKTITVNHDSSGNYSQSKSASFTTNATSTYSLKSGSASVTVNPPKIDRYASCTQSLSVRNINSITINWSSDSAVNHLWYSTNNGNSWTDVGNLSNVKSGNYTIKNLSPNTTYYIKTRIRRSDNNLTTDSSTLTATTFDYAKLSSVPDVNIGDSQTITWSNPMGATLKLALYTTDESTLVQDFGSVGSGTSKTVTVSDSKLYNLLGSRSNIKLKYVLTTPADGTEYKSVKECLFYASGSGPIFTNFAFKDTNDTTVALTGNNKKFIRRYSDVEVTISVANKMIPQNYADGSYYDFYIANKNRKIAYSSSSSVSGTIYNMDGTVANVYAVDSRGLRTLVYKNLTIIPYTECQINSLRVDRSNGVGTSVNITMSGRYSDIDFGNVENSVKSIQMRAKKTSSGSWTSWQSIKPFVTCSNGRITASGVNYTGITFELGENYTIQVKVTDELSSATEEVSLTDGQVLYSAAKGMGVCFGELYDTDLGGPLQIGKARALSTENIIDDLNSDSVVDALSANQGREIAKKIQTINGLFDKYSSVEKATEIYYNSSGTTGTVSLDEAISSFDFLDIYYKKSGNYLSKRVTAESANVALDLAYLAQDTSGSDQIFQIISKIVKISQYSITKISESYVNIARNYTTAETAQTAKSTSLDCVNNEIYIYKVVGITLIY